MAENINLLLTKSLNDFDRLLDEATETITSRKISIVSYLEDQNVSKFQIGKYYQIRDRKNENDESIIFWIGYDWSKNIKFDPYCLWLEFDARTCPEKYWDKINKLVGTSGKYISEIDFEFSQEYMNAWIHFFLKQEYLMQFFDYKTDLNTQRKTLIGFINEVIEKIK